MNDNELKKKQERFCELYATNREFFGNGVESYLEVYDIDRTKPNWYKTACSAASRLLSNVRVCERINSLLENGGLNDLFVDKQLGFLITQHCDFTNKLGAIREYNKLKNRVTERFDHTTKGEKITGTKIIKCGTDFQDENRQTDTGDRTLE